MKMIRLSCCFFICLFLAGCSRYVQFVYTAPSDDNVKEEKDYYVYENDTIKVVYSFWVERGIMSFMVRNKLDIPIYIDWKKSSYINKNMKLDYYMDKEVKKSSSVSTSYFYKGSVNWATIFRPSIVSGSVGYETVVREERITFIPPKSYIFRGFYGLMPTSYFSMNKAEIKTVSVSSNTYTTYFIAVKKDNATFVFRNFLTYSTKENFEIESYVNNEFYVKEVFAVNRKNFYSQDLDNKPHISNWEDHRNFFIQNLDKNSLQIPKKNKK